jgi:hypothetical protein
MFHQNVISRAVRLYAFRMYGGTLARIEHPVLERHEIRRSAHFTAERVDLEYEMTFARTAYRRIARHIPDRVEIHRE